MDTEIHMLRELLEELRKDVGFLKEMYKVGETTEENHKGICEGVTGKGTPCKNSAVDGAKYCRMHGREKVEIKRVRVKKEVKPKKIQPEHNHQLGELPLTRCLLCETHGDVLDPELPNAKFEGDTISLDDGNQARPLSSTGSTGRGVEWGGTATTSCT
jgi:hypothetical protein